MLLWEAELPIARDERFDICRRPRETLKTGCQFLKTLTTMVVRLY